MVIVRGHFALYMAQSQSEIVVQIKLMQMGGKCTFLQKIRENWGGRRRLFEEIEGKI